MVQTHIDVHTLLRQQGLTDTEILLYLTSLRSGPLSTIELAKHSGIKRTTAHSALASLVQKGMMALHTQTGSTRYRATDPSMLERKFVEQIDLLTKQRLEFLNTLPLFDEYQHQSGTTTETIQYQGMSGVKTAVDTALYCASRTWKIIAPEKNVFSEAEKGYAEYFIRVRKQRGVRARSLWEPGFVAKRTFDTLALEFRDPRILPKQLAGKFKSTVVLFDSSVLFVTSAKELSAVLIRSPEINQTMSVFFDGLWMASSPIPKRKLRKST